MGSPTGTTDLPGYRSRPRGPGRDSPLSTIPSHRGIHVREVSTTRPPSRSQVVRTHHPGSGPPRRFPITCRPSRSSCEGGGLIKRRKTPKEKTHPLRAGGG